MFRRAIPLGAFGLRGDNGRASSAAPAQAHFAGSESFASNTVSLRRRRAGSLAWHFELGAERALYFERRIRLALVSHLALQRSGRAAHDRTSRTRRDVRARFEQRQLPRTRLGALRARARLAVESFSLTFVQSSPWFEKSRLALEQHFRSRESRLRGTPAPPGAVHLIGHSHLARLLGGNATAIVRTSWRRSSLWRDRARARDFLVDLALLHLHALDAAERSLPPRGPPLSPRRLIFR